MAGLRGAIERGALDAFVAEFRAMQQAGDIDAI